MSLMAKQNKTIKHKTLSSYYPKLYILGDFLNEFINDKIQIIKEKDPKSYKDLLKNTICTLSNLKEYNNDLIIKEKLKECKKEGNNSETQQEIIDYILRDLLKTGDKNILITGNRFPKVDLPINILRPNIDNRHVNNSSSLLRNTEWKLLRARIGDEAFKLILIQLSIFLPIGNNCFIQLSGIPIYELYDHSKFVQSESNKTGQSDDSKESFQATLRCRRKRKRSNTDEDMTFSKKSKINTRSLMDVKIPRQRIYYGHASRNPQGKITYGLPQSHPLHKLCYMENHFQLSNIELLRFAQTVIPSILGQGNDDNLKTKGNKYRLEGVLGMINELVARYRKIDFRHTLRSCVKNVSVGILKDDHPNVKPSTSVPITQVFPDPTSQEDSKPFKLREAGDAIPPLLKPVSHGQVCRYIIAIFRRLFSSEMLGSRHNLDTLTSHVKRFVKAKQFEPINLHSLLQGIQINEFQWNRIDPHDNQRISVSEATKRTRVVEDFIEWIFSSFLIPLLRHTFYITETSTTRYETVYYTHEDWYKATKPHMDELKDNLLVRLNKTESYFAQQGPLGVSAVRLIPKPQGFRPIVNMGKKIKSKNVLGIPIHGFNKKEMTANQILKGVHQILTFEKDRHRASLGASLFGTNEIFGPIQHLKADLNKKYGKVPNLYFVKMDIKSAFDTIKQGKMIDVVSNLLDKNHDYCVMLYCLLLPPASQASHGASRRLFKSRAVVDDHIVSTFGGHAQEIAKPLRNAVIVDLVRRKQITREACLDLLKIHIQNNVWQIGKQFYRQKVGIPQGSKISSLLCSFFYACMENEFLAFTRQQGSRLLRYIDDFLYITDSPNLARRFVETMTKGFPTYGAQVSSGKTLLSFECETRGQMGAIIDPGDDGQILFPYCGFLINTKTLDVMSDHPRLLIGPIKQSFAIRSDRHKGSTFISWFSRQLENRNHIAYLDTVHNDINTVHLNIYINFALTSMKIPYYFKSDEIINQRREQLIVDSLINSIEYTYLAGKARINHVNNRKNDIKNHYNIKKSNFIFLALNAIIMILNKKSKYKGIINLLKLRLKLKLSNKQHYKDKQMNEIIEKGWNVIKNAKY
ncbi:uncharacterized protein I206_107557 [Kwoniella pini CBS 10737]|uniref:Telomerase reverse transcriptase n=1 Tax=Kwoniella pini CBS 10737 TaxID=1296096 RepID=A0AAJ8LDM2_9TREE